MQPSERQLAQGAINSASITQAVIILIVISSFRNHGTEDVFNGEDTGAARRMCPRSVWSIARRKLDQINRVRELRDLGIPPGNRLVRLREDREGQHSIRIIDQLELSHVV
jgi:proteic killer suppression protein